MQARRFAVPLLRRCVDRTSQHSPWGSTQDFLGSVPMRAVPIWYAEKTVELFFLMPAAASPAHRERCLSHSQRGAYFELWHGPAKG